MNENLIPVKRGRGRTAGSYSFVQVSVAQLCEQLKEGTMVPISRKWAENFGLKNLAPARNSIETLKMTSVSSAEPEVPKLNITIEA